MSTVRNVSLFLPIILKKVCCVEDFIRCFKVRERVSFKKGLPVAYVISNEYRRKEGNKFKPCRPVNKILFAGILSFFGFNNDEITDGENRIIYMIKLAILSQQRGESEKAEQLLHVALKSAQDLQNYQAQNYILDLMANNAYDSGNYHKAEKLFIETLKRLIAEGMAQDNNVIIHISSKLAVLYGLFHEDEKAREGFRFCVDKLNGKLNKGFDDFDTLALYCMVLCWYGEFLYSREAYQEALMYFQQSYDISIQVHGQHHLQSLLLLNNIAAVYSVTGQFQKAVENLNNAIKLAQEQPIENNSDLPSYYCNLGNVYLNEFKVDVQTDKEELLKKALEYCNRGLHLARKFSNDEAIRQAEECLASIKSCKK